VASFLGGTGLLIVVSVGLDLMQRIEANLLMRNYSGFLSGGEQGRPARIRSPRGR
jgi:preprotein translocase subunit SecY